MMLLRACRTPPYIDEYTLVVLGITSAYPRPHQPRLVAVTDTVVVLSFGLFFSPSHATEGFYLLFCRSIGL